MDDSELLRRYATDGCSESFALIVRRHIGWVYSASLRQVGEAALAEDVTQSVFILLTRRAGELGDGVVLRGWLFNTLRFVAREARRKQGRRQRHEAIVAGQRQEHISEAVDEGAWAEMSPYLDEAVASLRESDRQAVLLRFYEGKSFAEVAEALGTSEVAARKRVSRAVERLGAFFKRKGVVVTAAVLVAGLARASEAATAAAPGELLWAICGAAKCGGGTAAAAAKGAVTPAARSLARRASRRILRGRKRLVAAIVACVGGVGIGVWLLLNCVIHGDSGDEVAGLLLRTPESDLIDLPAADDPAPLLPARRAWARFEVNRVDGRPRKTLPAGDGLKWAEWWLAFRQTGQTQRHTGGGGGAGNDRADGQHPEMRPEVMEAVDWIRSWFESNDPLQRDGNFGAGLGGGGAQASAGNGNGAADSHAVDGGAGGTSSSGHKAASAAARGVEVALASAGGGGDGGGGADEPAGSLDVVRLTDAPVQSGYLVYLRPHTLDYTSASLNLATFWTAADGAVVITTNTDGSRSIRIRRKVHGREVDEVISLGANEPIDLGNGTGLVIDATTGAIHATPTPEPGVVGLLAVAAVTLLGRRRDQ